MNSNFNRQFIMIDFRLLENKEFLKFLASSEFATYLILRKYIWRGLDPHYMGLNDLYVNEKLLVSSIERGKVAEITGVHVNNISHHLTSLESKGIIKVKRTGRQNIYTLGEWIDIQGDGSYKGVEWFYLEGLFGLLKSDLTQNVRSDTPNMLGQNKQPALGQTKRLASHNNIEDNKEYKTIMNGDKNRSNRSKLLINLPTLSQPKEKTQYIVDFIMSKLNSKHSRKFYEIVAAKVPEDYIRRVLSEIRTDGARSPEKVFTYRMMTFALEQTNHS
jgi:DNA-binding transcriptional ArsR family regulator